MIWWFIGSIIISVTISYFIAIKLVNTIGLKCINAAYDYTTIAMRTIDELVDKLMGKKEKTNE